MIEIIREEESGSTTERRGLPKDIKQMGKPDIGDRIYVENEAYEFLHPYSNVEEKSAYVLLGRFENFAGRECVFVEAAIRLEEIAFDGELPMWNDQTWAYIYKQLRREYDNMVIVGWAMDIKGQLPNMTARVEQLHQSNFGGAHQVLLLMDSLEREEAFYGNRNGHLYRREGFYVYYDKKVMPYTKNEIHEENRVLDNVQTVYAAEETVQEQRNPWDWRAANRRREEQGTWSEYAREVDEAADAPGRTNRWRGSYRQQVEGQREHRLLPSYASTFFLAAVVCALGVTAYLNNEKMRAMEETLAQMNRTQVIEVETETQAPEVAVENVAGNVQKQNENMESLANAISSVTVDGTTETVQPVEDASMQGTEAAGEMAQTEEQTAQSTEAAQNSEATAQETTVESSSETAEATTAMTEAQTYLSQGYYIVQKGDSLVGICKRIYQTTAMMDKLCEVNEIEDADSIYAGQKLILPN